MLHISNLKDLKDHPDGNQDGPVLTFTLILTAPRGSHKENPWMSMWLPADEPMMQF